MAKKRFRLRGGASVPCPHCGGNTRVRVTRRATAVVKRVRQCEACGETFPTRESVYRMREVVRHG